MIVQDLYRIACSYQIVNIVDADVEEFVYKGYFVDTPKNLFNCEVTFIDTRGDILLIYVYL